MLSVSRGRSPSPHCRQAQQPAHHPPAACLPLSYSPTCGPSLSSATSDHPQPLALISAKAKHRATQSFARDQACPRGPSPPLHRTPCTRQPVETLSHAHRSQPPLSACARARDRASPLLSFSSLPIKGAIRTAPQRHHALAPPRSLSQSVAPSIAAIVTMADPGWRSSISLITASPTTRAK